MTSMRIYEDLPSGFTNITMENHHAINGKNMEKLTINGNFQ